MASWNEFVTLDGPTPAIGPKAIYTTDVPVLFGKFSTATMGTNAVAGHYMSGLDGAGNSQLESGVNASGFGSGDQKVDVSKQKHVFNVMCYGIANSSQTYVDRSLLAIRAGLSYRNGMTIDGVLYDVSVLDGNGDPAYLPDGGFPAQKFGTALGNHKFHNKWMFCEQSARALRMCEASAFYTGATATEVDALAVQLGEVAAWTIAAITDDYNEDFLKFYKNTVNVNQLIRVAVGLHEVGLLVGETDYTDAGQTRLEQIFSATVQDGQTSRHVSPEGIFKEKRDSVGDPVPEGAFDITYQTVSLDALCTYYMTLSAGAWKTTVYGFITRGVLRWLRVLQDSKRKRRPLLHQRGRGRRELLDDRDSTRTQVNSYTRSAVPVDWDRDIIPLRMHLWHYLGVSTALNLPIGLDELADKVMIEGPSLGHKSDDSDDDDEIS